MILKEYYRAVEIEVGHNLRKTQKLREVLEQSDEASSEIWEWAEAIVDAYYLSDYHALINSGVAYLIPIKKRKEINIAYRKINDLASFIRESRREYQFYSGIEEHEEKANQCLKKAKDNCGVIERYLEDAKKIIEA